MNILTIDPRVITDCLKISLELKDSVNSEQSQELHALLLSLKDTVMGSSDAVLPRMSLTAIQEKLPKVIDQVQEAHPQFADKLANLRQQLEIK